MGNAQIEVTLTAKVLPLIDVAELAAVIKGENYYTLWQAPTPDPPSIKGNQKN